MMIDIQIVKRFDLNIEEILEDWEVHDAIREIIVNALDEQKLTDTRGIEIFKDDEKNWHIRDYGRGLRYEHLTQKENEEKIKRTDLIGKFGIGLKDALATFDRKGVDVNIKSRHGDITTEMFKKHGFGDVTTLHAVITTPSDIIGTEVILSNLSDKNMDDAKALFLNFSGEELIDSTKYGAIYRKSSNNGKIFMNDVKVV